MCLIYSYTFKGLAEEVAIHKLRPTLWRTCRVIACETRLRLLWLLFDEKSLCVAELAKKAGISEQNASIQLRALNARGLVKATKVRTKVFYKPEPNEELESAVLLLDTLRQCHDIGIPFHSVIRQATAFTHERRIRIVRALSGSAKPFGALFVATGIPASSLWMHLEKLQKRGFVKSGGDRYRLAIPRNALGRVLLKIAVQDEES